MIDLVFSDIAASIIMWPTEFRLTGTIFQRGFKKLILNFHGKYTTLNIPALILRGGHHILFILMLLFLKNAIILIFPISIIYKNLGKYGTFTAYKFRGRYNAFLVFFALEAYSGMVVVRKGCFEAYLFFARITVVQLEKTVIEVGLLLTLQNLNYYIKKFPYYIIFIKIIIK